MTFVNQYPAPRLTLWNAATFREEKEPFVYAVGQGDGKAVALKTTTGGATVWTRELTIGQKELRFYDVVQLQGSSGFRYVIGASSGEQFHLVCIDTEGQELWLLEVVMRDADPNAFIVANAARDGFYFGYSDRSSDLDRISPKVLHVNADGKLLARRELQVLDVEHKGFVMSAIGAHPEGLCVAGRLNAVPSAGCTIFLTKDLEGKEATIYPGMIVQDMLVPSAERCVLSAYSSADDAVVVIHEGAEPPAVCFVIPESAKKESILCLGPKGSFLSVLDASKGEVYLVTGDGQVQWRKGLAIGNNELGVRSMTYEPALDRIAFTTVDVSLLGLTASEFLPCIVYPMSRPELPRPKLEAFRRPVRTEEIKVSIERATGNWQK